MMRASQKIRHRHADVDGLEVFRRETHTSSTAAICCWRRTWPSAPRSCARSSGTTHEPGHGVAGGFAFCG
ncbi:alpha/beta hydrolase fold [Micromonospora sp. B006]|nr:alpha/beta hydrolase fold [Micromonospora sp. B006]